MGQGIRQIHLFCDMSYMCARVDEAVLLKMLVDGQISSQELSYILDTSLFATATGEA